MSELAIFCAGWLIGWFCRSVLVVLVDVRRNLRRHS
jgi:hypothetical protein